MSTNPETNAVFVVLDSLGYPQRVNPTQVQCHDDIKDAIDAGVEGAAQWIVREYRIHVARQPCPYQPTWCALSRPHLPEHCIGTGAA